MTDPTAGPAAAAALETAIAHHRAGRQAEAEAIYRQLLAADANHAGATRMLGVLQSQRGQHAEAIPMLTRAVELTGGADPGTTLDLAIAWRNAGRPAEAEAAYRAALGADPKSAPVLAAYAEFLRQQRRLPEATAMLTKAVPDIDPPSAPLVNLIGITLAEQRQPAEAAEWFNRAIQIDPSLAQAHNNLGTAMMQLNALDDAEAEFRKALELDPNYALAQENLGTALIRQGRYVVAVGALTEAITLRPDFAEAHENLGWSLIALGDWPRGFAELEWRLKIPGRPVPRADAPQKPWQGEDLQGRTVLLYAEGPFGDAIQCARYVQLVAKRGGRTVVACPPGITQLLAGVHGVGQVLGPDDVLPAFHLHCPLMSLPHVFGTTPETVPSAKAAYLHAPDDRVAHWKERLSTAGRKKVGLVLSGEARDAVRVTRTIPTDFLDPLRRVEGATFFTLRDGDGGEPAPSWATADFSTELQDTADAAGLMRNLDMILTPDVSFAHIAGALGRPTVLMLPHAADPRWMTNRSDTPWYGSVRLFRQKHPGNWTEVIERVARSLAEWVKK